MCRYSAVNVPSLVFQETAERIDGIHVLIKGLAIPDLDMIALADDGHVFGRCRLFHTASERV